MSSSKRLRAINSTQTPRSSLGRRLGQSSPPDATQLGDHRAPKRQRHSEPTKSPYFTPQKPDVDLTHDSSHADTKASIDLVSNSSAGKTAGVASKVQEFRDVENRVKVPGRRRRRRTPKDDRLETHVRDSPDVLASPPPANVVSDITPFKRKSVVATEMTNPPIKRAKINKRAEIIEDEDPDELSLPGPEPKQGSKRTTNFSALSGPKPRGDIRPTVFKSKQEPASSPGRDPPPQNQPLVIVRACSGKFLHPPASDRNKFVNYFIRSDQAIAESTVGGEVLDLSWLNLKRSKVIGVKHRASHSNILLIKRSATIEAPSDLDLEFESIQDALKMFQWLSDGPSLSTFKEVEDEQTLRVVFSRRFKQAEDFKPQTETPETKTVPLDDKSSTSGLSRNTNPPVRRDPFNPDGSRPVKLKDGMKGSDKPGSPAHETRTFALRRSQGVETRRTRRSSLDLPTEETVLARWSHLNPNWHENWHKSLVFPPTGRNRATVDMDDIPRLDEGEFLNDNLINFYFRYLQAHLEATRPELLQKVYFFSTFFYEKLKSGRGKINYDGVKAWTARVDLMSYKYIIVPVNENAHWYLAIIYNAPQMLPQDQSAGEETEKEGAETDGPNSTGSPRLATVEKGVSFISLEDQPKNGEIDGDAMNDASKSSPSILGGASQEGLQAARNKKTFGGPQKYDPDSPRIITLDSLGSAHSATCRLLKEYLIQEALHKREVDLTSLPGGMTGKNIPEQTNFCDCGVFILGYVEEFLKNPDEAVRKLLQKEDLNWSIGPSEIRNKVRNLVFDLQREQQARLEKEQQEKKQRLLERKAKKEAPSSTQTPQTCKEIRNEPAVKPAEQDEIRSAKSVQNGIRPTVESDEAHNVELLGSPILGSSPTPIRRIPSKSNGMLQLVAPLDESGEGHRSSNGEIFLSAPQSPLKKVAEEPTKSLVDLTSGGEKPSRSGGGLEKGLDGFVQPLSSSSEEAVRLVHTPWQSHRSPKPKVRFPSPGRDGGEVIVTHGPTPSPRRQRRHSTSSSRLLPSIESEPHSHRAQYDGIDRSIDLTR